MITDKINNRGEEMSPLGGTDRLHYLIDIAKEVEPLQESEKIEATCGWSENKVKMGICITNTMLMLGLQKELLK